MVAYIDNAGPTLFVDTALEMTIEHLTPVLAIRYKRNPFTGVDPNTVHISTLTAGELHSKGIFQGNSFIQ